MGEGEGSRRSRTTDRLAVSVERSAQTRWVHRAAARLYTRSDGAGGPALVWCHGLYHDHTYDQARGLYPPLALTRHTELIRLDAPGHGHSRPAPEDPDRYRWPAIAQDMLATASAWHHHSFIAGGASMGAASALHAALQAPERVLGLILAIPPTAWTGRPAQAERYRQLASILNTRGPAAFKRAMAQAPLAPAFLADWDRDLTALRHAHLERFDAHGFAAVLEGAARSDLPPPAALSNVHQPCLLLAWAGDGTHPVETAEVLHQALPNSQLHLADHINDVRQWPSQMADFVRAIAAPAS